MTRRLISLILLICLTTFSFADDYELGAEVQKEFECMVQNLHHEARGESTKGIIAVANVVLNRKNMSDYPNTICGVVYQKHQFSWVGRQKTKSLERIDSKIKFIAYEAIVNNTLKDITNGALFFKTKNAKPNWNYGKLIKTITIGNHEFYKFRKDVNA